MSIQQIQSLEKQIFELNQQLIDLKKSSVNKIGIENYKFDTLTGNTDLLSLFSDKSLLLVIHNMGQACRYCTLWADGFNGLLPHLESVMSVVLVSKDTPEIQRKFANSRGWNFNTASHINSNYIKEQTVMEDQNNMPGAIVYEKVGNKIIKKNSCIFGPGDLYCAMWSLLGLAGIGLSDWTPQYTYWQRPNLMDDGGENILE